MLMTTIQKNNSNSSSSSSKISSGNHNMNLNQANLKNQLHFYLKLNRTNIIYNRIV